MAAGTSTPAEAGQGPSVLNIAMSIGAKIRDAAEDAKQEREKAAEKGETPKKGSLFKSSLSNQFNPIKSKKAKSNWAKQFDWNKTTKSDQQVKPPTGGGGEGKAKLKEFIAGGFTAILKDTGLMVSKLDGVKMMAGENLSEVTRASSTLTVIKDSVDTQTELRRKALEEAKFARAEKKLEKTKDTAGVSGPKTPEDATGGKGGGGEDGGGGGGPFDWLLGALGIADILENFLPGIKKLNPFKKSPVTQGKGGKPSSPRMPGTGPKVTTSGGAPAPAAKQPWWKKMLPFADDAAKGGAKAGAKGAGGLLGRLLPGAQTALGIGLAAKSFSEGDAIGGALNLGSALPGPLGWAFLAASLGRDTFAPGLGNKELGQAFSTPGLTPEQTSGMSGLERGMLDISSPSFTGFSEGGIVPSAVPPSPISPMAEGGIAPGLYNNPTQGMLSPGQSVIPLNRSEGKAMFGKSAATSPSETAIDTVGAMILGVSAGMLGKTDSGTVGDQVKQDIRKASKEFGIANLTFTSSIGNGKFGRVDTNKDAKAFMKGLFEGLKISGTGGGNGGGGGNNNQQNPPPGGEVGPGMTATGGSKASQYITSGFGQRNTGIPGASTNHGGIDISGGAWQKGAPISVIKPGTVEETGDLGKSGWGKYVVIKHDDGTYSLYGHLDSINVKKGDKIENKTGAATVIGKLGSTGVSSGPHLHFELGRGWNGTILNKVDPAPYVDSYIRGGGKVTVTGDAPQVVASNKPSNKLPTGSVTPVANPATPGAAAKPAEGGLSGIIKWLMSPSSKSKDFVGAARSAAASGSMGKDMQAINNRRAATDAAIQQMLGHEQGGVVTADKGSVMRRNAAQLKAKNASKQRERLGVYKVNGKWVNMGVGDQAVGSNPWWQVWNKKGATAERKAKQEKLAKSLAERLNKQEAAKLKPKPAAASPGRTPVSAGGTRPSTSTTAAPSSTTAVLMPPVTATTPSSSAEGSFGSGVPTGKTKAMIFADFLYPDLV